MTRGLPPAVLLPARADLFHGKSAEQRAQPTLCGTRELTVTIEDRSPTQGRRFVFHAARQADDAAHEPNAGQAFLFTDQRPDPKVLLDHPDAHSSAPFLAAAIAQMHPSPVLHDPSSRQAAGAYRRSDDLGADLRMGLRSDQKV